MSSGTLSYPIHRSANSWAGCHATEKQATVVVCVPSEQTRNEPTANFLHEAKLVHICIFTHKPVFWVVLYLCNGCLQILGIAPHLLKPDDYKLHIQEMQCLNFQLSEISELMQFGFSEHLLDVCNCRKTLCSCHFSQSLNSNSQSSKTATELCPRRRAGLHWVFILSLHITLVILFVHKNYTRPQYMAAYNDPKLKDRPLKISSAKFNTIFLCAKLINCSFCTECQSLDGTFNHFNAPSTALGF